MAPRVAPQGEEGVATITVVLLMPVFILFFVFVIDVGNWYVHKRHLQNQADAAALAGASAFRFPACDASVNTKIENLAKQYSGVGAGDGTAAFNDRLPTVDGGRLHAEVNKPTYFGQSTPPDDDLAVADTSPCATKMVDVKMTERNLPFFFGDALVPNINARARVGIKTLQSLDGLLPVGVEEVNPKRAHAFFFDEDSGTQLGDAPLKLRGSAGSLLMYDNRAGQPGTGPVTFNVTQRRIGVRVVLSGDDAVPLSTVNCSAPPSLVVCYGYGTANSLPTNGLARIRGNDTSSVQTLEDLVAGVALDPGAGCAATDNGYFHDKCTSVRVTVSMVGLSTAQRDAGDIVAKISGSNQAVDLDPLGTPGSSMTFTGLLPVIQDVGPHNIDLEMVDGKVGPTASASTCKQGNNNPAACTAGNVHRTFAAARGPSGPIKSLELEDAAGVPFVNHNVQRCTSTCTSSFVVSVGLAGKQSLAAPGDPPVALRVAVKDPSLPGNQTKSLQCDPAAGGASGLEDQLALGCAPKYTPRTGSAPCPNKATLFASAQPWSCVAVKTGNAPNSPPRGLNRRILCSAALGDATNCSTNGSATSCTQPNRWSNRVPSDPRIVAVFLVPFGSLDGSGADETVPIIGIANFYVTGYTGQGGVSTPCRDIVGVGADEYAEDPPDDGTISGRFLIADNPGAEGGTADCDFSAINACVTALIK